MSFIRLSKDVVRWGYLDCSQKLRVMQLRQRGVLMPKEIKNYLGIPTILAYLISVPSFYY